MSEIKGSCLRCDYWGVRNQGYLRLEELYLKNAHFSGVRNQGYSVLALSETKGLSSSGTVRKTGYTAVGLRQDTESYEIQELLSTINIEEELQYAKMGYIDNTIDQSILDGIDVWTTDENGEVSYSVRKLGNLETSGTSSSRNTTDGTVYVLAATKTARDDQEGYGMESHLVMGWIDNLGPANELVYVSGSWITGNYTILGRMVDFGVAGANDVYIESEVHNPTGNTFYYTPENEMVGLKLLAYSTIVSEESDAAEDALYCRVCPTFLD